MPISGSASYIPTTAEFLAHWVEVNRSLPEALPLTLNDGADAKFFEETRAELLEERNRLEDADLRIAEARVAIEKAKEPLLMKLRLFNQMVRGVMGESVYAKVLPLVPGVGEGQEIFNQRLIQVVKLWERINVAPPSGATGWVVLVDGTTQAEFASLVAKLPKYYEDAVGAEQGFSICLHRRNELQTELYTMMKQYRQAVPTRILPGEELLETMPFLTPESGRSPQPVSLEAEWMATEEVARITVGASLDTDLKEYELRWCAGAKFFTTREHLVGVIPAGETPIFQTSKGLTTSGSVVSFRAYVRLKGGGDAASNTVTLTRP